MGLAVPLDDWADLPGKLYVVSGASGSGKSTLVRRVIGRPEVRAQALHLGDDPAPATERGGWG